MSMIHCYLCLVQMGCFTNTCKFHANTYALQLKKIYKQIRILSRYSYNKMICSSNIQRKNNLKNSVL